MSYLLLLMKYSYQARSRSRRSKIKKPCNPTPTSQHGSNRKAEAQTAQIQRKRMGKDEMAFGVRTLRTKR